METQLVTALKYETKMFQKFITLIIPIWVYVYGLYFFKINSFFVRHTHCEHTPGAVGSHIAVAPGEQFWVRCLAQGSHLSRGIEGGRER